MLFLTVLNAGYPFVHELHRVVPAIPEKHSLAGLAIFTMGLFVAIGLSPVVDMVIRYVKGYRKMLRDERDVFDHAFSEVVQKSNKSKEDYLVFVYDGNEIESDSLGLNSLGVTRKLLKYLTPDEIKAAIAHEIGHLSLGHGIQIRVFFAVNVLGQISLWLTKRLLVMFKNLYSLEIPIASWFGVFGFISCKFLRIAIEILLFLPLLIGAVIGFRQNEYAADRFAIGLGYGEALHSYLLKKLDDRAELLHNGRFRFIRWAKNMIWPDPGKRLVEVEKII